MFLGVKAVQDEHHRPSDLRKHRNDNNVVNLTDKLGVVKVETDPKTFSERWQIVQDLYVVISHLESSLF